MYSEPSSINLPANSTSSKFSRTLMFSYKNTHDFHVRSLFNHPDHHKATMPLTDQIHRGEL
jgi:hypothetical protein